MIGSYELAQHCFPHMMCCDIRYCTVCNAQVVGELWRPAGGAYNVDNVLKVMVTGLEHELQARLDGKQINAMSGNYPSPVVDAEYLKIADLKLKRANSNVPANIDDTLSNHAPIQQQGADVSIPIRRLWRWISARRVAARRQK